MKEEIDKVIINGIEYIPKNEHIEELHKRQITFIKDNNLSVGDIILVKNKENKTNHLQIVHLHINYGWIRAVCLKTGYSAHMIDPINIVGIYNQRSILY